LGDEGVGKTSLVMRLISNSFPEPFDPTISDMYKTTIVGTDGNTINVEILDTIDHSNDGCGHGLLSENQYMNSTNGYVIVYALDNEESFKHVPDYVNKKTHFSAGAPVLILGNKSDVKEGRAVTFEQGHSCTTGAGMKGISALFSEVSAKTGENVEEMVHKLIFASVPLRKGRKEKA